MNIIQIARKLRALNDSYRQGKPLATDEEYDALVEELRRRDPDHEWFKRIEPGYAADGRKAKLPIPMKSLKKAKSLKELQAWAKSIGLKNDDVVVLTPKFDGLSLLYEEATGRAYSRGGFENEGMDCTDHARTAKVPTAETLLKFTYGEFLFSRDGWEEGFLKAPESGAKDRYKSPRNTAVGLLMQNEPSPLLKHCSFYRYGADDESMSLFRTYRGFFDYACRAYGQQPLCMSLKVSDLSDSVLDSSFKIWNSIFYCDGLVAYANDLSVWERAGRDETTGNPNYAIAYKSPAFTDAVETTVKGVTWNVTRGGYLKPLVDIDPLDFGTCTVNSPSGFHAKFVRENGIAEGAKVMVKMAGSVIPNICSVTQPAPDEAVEKLWKSMEKCPMCGAPTYWNESGVELCCSGNNCPGKTLAEIAGFYQSLGAKNVGEDIFSLVYKAGYRTLRSMLNITFRELIKIEGIGEVKANYFLYANQQILDGVDIADLMVASNCFKGIGLTKAKEILSKMSEGEQWAFINGRYNIAEEYFQTLSFQKAPKMMQAFYKGVGPFYDFVARNRLVILPMKAEALVTSAKYKGVKAAFSGFRDKALEDMIIAGGGEIVAGVAKKTTHVITLNKEADTAKIVKAREMGIPILLPDEFKRL